MYRVIVKKDKQNDIIVANIPNEIRAGYLADILQGEVVEVEQKKYRFKNYLKKSPKPKFCNNCKNIPVHTKGVVQ